MQSRNSKLVIAAVIVAVVFAVIMTLTRTERPRDLVLSIQPVDPSDEVTVYVSGAVAESGLFSLSRGSRVSDVLDVAGLLDDADTSSLQMARTLTDGQTVRVPVKSMPENDDSGANTGWAAETNTSNQIININQATDNELQTLPGIGPALSERIMDRRDIEGPFQTIDELSSVSGISDRMVDEIREYATVGP